MSERMPQPDPVKGFIQVVGVGGIGTGTVLALDGGHTLGRNESRLARVLDARDYCKLHIVEHYIAALLGARQGSFRVLAVGNVGDDAAGDSLLREMADAGIDTRFVRIERERDTLFSVCFLYPDRSGGNITASNSAASALDSRQLQECRRELAVAGSRGIALCLPEAPIEARQEFLQIAGECGSYRVASFLTGEMERARSLNLLFHVDLLALNEEEAVALSGGPALPDSHTRLLHHCSRAALAANPKMKIVVSAGARGAYVYDEGEWRHHGIFPVDAVSTAGAGDALLAGLITGLAVGLPLTRRAKAGPLRPGSSFGAAIDLGLTLACFSVTSSHTIHPDVQWEKLLSFAREKKILTPEEPESNRPFIADAIGSRSS